MQYPSTRARRYVVPLVAMAVALACASSAVAATKKPAPKKKTTTTTAPKASPTTTPVAAPATTVLQSSTTVVAAKPTAASGKVGEQLTVAVAAAPNSLNPALANVGTANLNINPKRIAFDRVRKSRPLRH